MECPKNLIVSTILEPLQLTNETFHKICFPLKILIVGEQTLIVVAIYILND